MPLKKVNPGTEKAGYDINPVMLSLLHSRQYKGDGTEDPHSHIDFFENICGTFKLNAFTDDEMRLKIFSQTLVDKALLWYKSQSPGAFDIWK